MMGSPSDSLTNCLICDASFDVKPTLFVTSEENDGNSSEEAEGTHNAFILFCKLALSKTSEESEVCIQLLGEMFENLCRPIGGGGRRQFENIWKSPFCSQCYQGIVEVRKLETIINETRMLQKCILDDLKKSLISSHSSSSEGGLPSTSSGNRVCVAIRSQLVTNLGSEEIPSEAYNYQEAFSQNVRLLDIKEDPDKCQSEESDSDDSLSVKHQRLSSRKNLKRRLNLDEAGDQSPPPTEFFSLLTSDSLDDAGNVCSQRESEVVKEIYHDSNSPSNSSNNDSDWHNEDRMTSSDSEVEEIPAPTGKKGGQARSTVSARKQTKSSARYKTVKDTVQPKKKKWDPPIPTATSSLVPSRLEAGGSRQAKLRSDEEGNVAGNKISEAKSQRFRHWYWIIPHKNLFLLLNSLIKYEYMQRLECLEEDCGHVVDGTSTLSFENMREHVSVRHPGCGKGGTRTLRKCPFCGEHVHWLKPHLNEKHRDLPKLKVLCEVCWKPVMSVTPEIHRHAWLHKNEEEQAAATAQYEKRAESFPVECPECGKRFRTQHNLSVHEKTHQPKSAALPIPSLKASGSRQGNLSDEEGNVARNKTSEVKSQRFRNWYRIIPSKNLLLLLNSLIKYEYMQRLECLEQECCHVVEGTSALSFEKMREHVSVHHRRYLNDNRSLRKCPFCGDLVHWLKPHFKEKHPDIPELRVFCEICWKPLTPATPKIHRHAWLHKNEEEQAAATAQDAKRAESFPVECTECGKRFKTQNNLFMHEKTHQPKSADHRIPKRKPNVRTPAQCKLCPSILCSNTSLVAHMYSHHNEGKEMSCPICNKKFHIYRKIPFQEHMRTHTNEKPFVCEICGKAFPHQTALKVHSTTHTSDKRFQCQFCGAQFKYNRGMLRHCRLRHPGMMKPSDVDKERAAPLNRPENKLDFIGPKQMFPCDFCEKVFQWRSRMTKHMKLSHSQQFANFDST